MPFRWLSVSLTLAIFPLAESVYSALVNFASVSTLQAKSNTLDKALLCSLWQERTPAPPNIAFVLQKQYRTPILTPLANHSLLIFVAEYDIIN